MTDPPDPSESIDDKDAWDFEGARRQHLLRGLRMTYAERLRWLEETVEEMRKLQGLARLGVPVDGKQGTQQRDGGSSIDLPPGDDSA